MSAIEVLKNNLRIIDGLDEDEELSWSKESKESLVKSLKEVLLALEKQKNGLKCIGCGSIPKLKLCCNSCYQRLKLKEKRQVELIEWLEKEIKTMEDLERINYTGAFQNDLRILKEVLERVGEQK